MVSTKEESVIYNIKLCSVGPCRVTGVDVVHEPTNMDLAMKLHYLRGVYYFSSQAMDGLTILGIKEVLFKWLDHFYVTCGRFRRSESGRPYIKCNDCGVRFIEAQCVYTLDQWLHSQDHDVAAMETKLLVSNQVIGPELAFSPTVLLQHTRFKCGGAAWGLSWAHVLGDAFSATNFMNVLGQVMAGHTLPKLINNPPKSSSPPPKLSDDPLSVKRVGPVGDNWIHSSDPKMGVFSFHVNATQLSDLQSKLSCDTINPPPFESVCAIIWQCVAKIRKLGAEPKIVTICKKDYSNKRLGGVAGGHVLSNKNQVISVVKAATNEKLPSIMETDPKELAELLMNQAVDERSQIEEASERDEGLSDFILYGANLTFVDLEEADLYGMELKEEKPLRVSYTIDGVAEGGVVLVLPGQPDQEEGGGGGGRIVTIIMPENQVMELKSELKRGYWSIA